MKRCICILILWGLLVSLSSCKTVEPENGVLSKTSQELANYTLTIRIKDAGANLLGDVLDRVRSTVNYVNITHLDWGGLFNDVKQIQLVLIAISEKEVNVICSKIDGLPNIIMLDIKKCKTHN